MILLGEIADGEDPLLGLGGSAYLHRLHGLKTGLPPRCDLTEARELHEAVRSLIYGESVQSAHDCSEGGLAVTLAECCISQQLARETPRLMGAQIDLSVFKVLRQDALLFGESQSRIVISTSPQNAGKILAQAKILGGPASVIGRVGGLTLSIKTPATQLTWDLLELHDVWWNTIARAMR